MITYEQDPDVVRWGLQLFESDPYFNNPYCQAPVAHQQEGTDYSGHFNRLDEEEEAEESNDDNGFGVDGCNVENDELVARSLQMELSELAVAEEEEEDEEKELAGEESVDDGASANQERNVGISGFQHDCWLGGQQDGAMAAAAAASSSCSATLPTQGENSYHGGEWSYSLDPATMTTATAVADDYYYAAFDGEVGEWLNEMVPIPHVPRINGEIPSVDEATLDHQRLLERLQVYDLVERKVQGDGNCQFRALSDQLYRTTEHHEFVRQEVVNQLKSYPEVYEGYVPMAYGDYLEKMCKSGEWGDHVTLQAAADSYGVKIIVMTSFKDTCYIEILPNVQRSKRVILLSFWAEVHYNSIFQKGDVPEFATKKKKRWRMFRNKHLESPDIYQGLQ